MNELLKALADNDRELQAPEAVEQRLRAAFRKKYARPRWPYFALAVAAAIVLFVATRPRPQIHREAAPIAAIVRPTAIVPVASPAPRRAARRPAPPREIVTEFFPLMEDPPPFERGELLRVRLPASAMRGVGLPVSEDHLDDPVQADVLVGQEGLARAIRFVRYEH
jgi:hypothetical protein